MMTWGILWVLSIAAIIAWSSYREGKERGFKIGMRMGEDMGWNDCEYHHLVQEQARERARRNRLGQFKGKGAGNG